MDLPLALAPELSQKEARRWQEHFAVPDAERERIIEEGLWRRTQELSNASESGWRTNADAKRRLLHYRYQFDLLDGHPIRLAIKDIYVFFSLALPVTELRPQIASVLHALNVGRWVTTLTSSMPSGASIYRRGDLICLVTCGKSHPVDVAVERTFPPKYGYMDVTIQTGRAPRARTDLPWQVLAGGMRKYDTRGAPQFVDDLRALSRLQPFHVELGCGISLAAGIPPLHRLHELYGVTDVRNGRFIFSEPDGGVLAAMLADPEQSFAERAVMFRSCLCAVPTPAHRALRSLRDAGALLEPIFTNNFDGLASRVGLRERYLRRYDEKVPEVAFDHSSRALLVIGSHADRRKVQNRARLAGLQVVFCDPECFIEADGNVRDYLIEGAQDGDLICRRDASDALPSLVATLAGVDCV